MLRSIEYLVLLGVILGLLAPGSRVQGEPPERDADGVYVINMSAEEFEQFIAERERRLQDIRYGETRVRLLSPDRLKYASPFLRIEYPGGSETYWASSVGIDLSRPESAAIEDIRKLRNLDQLLYFEFGLSSDYFDDEEVQAEARKILREVQKQTKRRRDAASLAEKMRR